MEKLELHQRITHTYADGWADLDALSLHDALPIDRKRVV